MYTEMLVATWLGIANMLVLVAIIALNVRSYVRFKADYTLFVIVFSALFVLQYLVSAYFFFTHMSFYSIEVSRHILALTILQTAAFGYLLWMELQ